MFNLKGRTALVTGAGQNIGAGIARALSKQGAHVLVNDLIVERSNKVVSEITGAGGTASGVTFDVTDLDEVIAAIKAYGPVDIVVNNAGNGGAESMVPTPFKELDPSAWDAPIAVNLRGVMNTAHATIERMIQERWGRIITISSGAGNAGVGIGVAPYSAGKGGGIGFMRSLALEVAAEGITCNSVALGLMSNAAGEGNTSEAVGFSGRCRRNVRLSCIGRGQLGHRSDLQPQRRLRHKLVRDNQLSSANFTIGK